MSSYNPRVISNEVSNGKSGDRRVRRTRATLQSALMDLVQKQDLPRITVADVTERADVSRSTFYDHYQDVHELAEAACTAMIDALMASLPNPDDVLRDADGGTEVLRNFFAHFAEHANLYRSLLGSEGSARIIDHLRRRAIAALHHSALPGDTCDGVAVTAGDAETPHDVFAAFSAGAFFGVAIDWVQRDCPGTPAEMAALTWPLFAAALRVDHRGEAC
ncbi:TetR family transcriptional regulator [Mycobacterium sp. 852002-51057_SCH5723018]|nr:TetR family transcriptional regulator [Mycobacterium sp. 852002-51057_SCH5723018]